MAKSKRREKGIVRRGPGWQVRVMASGERYTETFPTLDLARAARDTWIAATRIRRAQVAAGILPAADLGRPAHVTVAELCARFILDRERQNRRPATIAFYRRETQCLINTCGWALSPAKDITPEMIKEHLERRKLATTVETAEIQRRALACLFSWATGEADLLDKNPMLKVPKYGIDEKEPRRLDEPQLGAFLLALDQATPQNRAFFLVLLYTGLRRSEIMAMDWDWIDLEGAELKVKRSKTRHLRKIPLATAAVDALRALPGRSGPVWIDRETGKKLSQPPYNALRRILNRAGLPRVGFHAFRHSFCTQALRAGVSLAVVQDLAGHRDPKMTRRYAKTDEEMTRRGVAALEGRLAGAQPPPPRE